MEITATNKFTGSESSAQLTLVLGSEDAPLITRVTGLVGAIILGTLFLFVILSGQKLHRRVQSEKEKKQLKRYVKALARYYLKKAKKIDNLVPRLREKDSEVELTELVTEDEKQTSVPTKTEETGAV